jgi:hypothetical protein
VTVRIAVLVEESAGVIVPLDCTTQVASAEQLPTLNVDDARRGKQQVSAWETHRGRRGECAIDRSRARCLGVIAAQARSERAPLQNPDRARVGESPRGVEITVASQREAAVGGVRGKARQRVRAELVENLRRGASRREIRGVRRDIPGKLQGTTHLIHASGQRATGEICKRRMHVQLENPSCQKGHTPAPAALPSWPPCLQKQFPTSDPLRIAVFVLPEFQIRLAFKAAHALPSGSQHKGSRD